MNLVNLSVQTKWLEKPNRTGASPGGGGGTWGADLYPGLLMQVCNVELATRRMGHQLVMLLQDLVETLHCIARTVHMSHIRHQHMGYHVVLQGRAGTYVRQLFWLAKQHSRNVLHVCTERSNLSLCIVYIQQGQGCRNAMYTHTR